MGMLAFVFAVIVALVALTMFFYNRKGPRAVYMVDDGVTLKQGKVVHVRKTTAMVLLGDNIFSEFWDKTEEKWCYWQLDVGEAVRPKIVVDGADAYYNGEWEQASPKAEQWFKAWRVRNPRCQRCKKVKTQCKLRAKCGS